jgi:hypothetical protein
MSEHDSLSDAYTTFCDDLRPEVGNKVSYMGVYQGTMFVEAFPLALPKLCAVVTARIIKEDVDRPLPLIFKVFANDSVIAERAFEPELVINSASSLGPFHDTLLATAFFQFTPFAADAPMLLKSRVYLGDCEIKAGTLEIRLPAKPIAPVR